MTHEEYTKVCEENPGLKLPAYWQLAHIFVKQLDEMTPEQLIAARLSAIMARTNPNEPDEPVILDGGFRYNVM